MKHELAYEFENEFYFSAACSCGWRAEVPKNFKGRDGAKTRLSRKMSGHLGATAKALRSMESGSAKVER